MAIDYESLAEVAERLVTENGRSLTLIKTSSVPTDSAKPWLGTSTSATETPCTGVVIPESTRRVSGDSTRRRRARAYIAADDVDAADVRAYNFVEDGSERWRIDEVSRVMPATRRILFVIELSR
jgi:hypothetical protein